MLRRGKFHSASTYRLLVEQLEMRLAPGDALLGGLLAASFAERASVGSDDPWTSGISVHDRPRTRAQLSLAAVQILPQSGAFTAQVAGLSDFGQTDCEERANTGGNRTQVVDAWNPDHPLPDRSLAQDADRLWSVPFPCHSAPEKRSANAPEAGPDRPAPGEQGMSGSAAAPPVDAGGRAESVPPDGATSLPSGPSAPILPPTAGRGMSGSVAFPPSGAGMGTPASSAPASLQANPLSQSNPLILSEPPGSGGTSGGSGSASPFVYFPDGPIGEQPPPVAPTPPDCNTVGMQPSPVVQPDANTGQGGAASTDAPVRDFDGLPLVTANDLSSNALGFPWGQTRSWTGLDNSSLNGNGWALSQLPYLVVGGGTNGQGSILYGTAADDRISVVEGGGQVFTFRVPASGPYASFVPWDAEKIRLDSIPGPTPVLRLTDSQGDVTDFYDVSRDATGRPLGHSLGVDLAQKFGRFKSYTPASGTSNVVASYDTAGYPTTVTRSDTVTGDTEQFVYAYATVTNDLVAAAGTTPPRLVASVTLQRPDANGNWQPVQRVQYTYYTGRLPNGVGGWVNDANGRLGDLELAQIENPVVTGDGSLTWQEINTDYYRYYKLTGESNGVPSQGPTNIAATTGGPAPLEPAGPYDPKAPSPFDDLVFSGLKTVVTGTAFDQLAAAVPNYQSASDAAIQPYVNNLFTYERWDDHIGTDGAYGSQPWDTTNIDINWRAGYRLGTRYRATEEMAQGAGCSLCAGGQGTYKYEYAANEDPTALGFNSIEYNTWRMKTTEFLPPTSPNWGDHNREVVYTDEVGQPLLDVFVQVGGPSLAVTGMTITASSATGATITVTAANHGFHTGDLVALSGVLPELYDGVFTVARIDANTFRFVLPSNYTTPVLAPTPSINQTIAGLTINSTVTKVTGQWATAYRYDGQGRLILKANPSAVSGYNDSQSDLLNSDSPGHFGYLYDHQGAIELTDYYATTTATEATPGGVAGYLKDREMEQGQLGTPILEESKQYFTHRVTDSTADVTVTTPAGTSVTSVADQFTYAPPPIPSVTGVGPNSGTDTGGSIVTLVGGTFTGVTGISFGETPAVSFVATDNVISVIAPPHAVGVVDITVTNRFGISATSAADRFTYWSSPPRDGGPVLTGLVPASGSAGGGDSVTLVGSNFSNAKAVYFGTTPAVSFSVLNDGVISARSPAHIAGAVDVTVITPSATSAVSAVGQFTYQPPAAPIITALSPSSGLSQGGTTVTLAGSHFTGATTVSFGGLATSFTILSDHVITARAPAHVAGSVDVTVTSLSGTSATSPADQFSYVATLPPPGPPKVIGLGPTSGSTAGGDTVVLVGSNFTGATAVAFGGTPAASFTLLSDSAIRAITPPQTVPTVYPVATDTVYRNTDGTGAETTSYEYTWLAGSTRMESQIITKPVVSASQNGPGVAGTQATIYDSAGRPIWQRDGDGFLTYTAYDPATSAVIEKITDVDTTRSGDFQNLPAGWATPPGGGLHLVTRYEVDAFGRTIAQTDPNGNTTYTVYDDAEHEVRTYAGWQASTGMPTGPTQVTRHDFAHSPSYTETLTMSAPPHLTNGRPDGTEPISGVVTLSRSFTSPGGQLIETDQYFSLAGVTYRTAPYLGIAGTNYYPTLLAYDQRGRLDRTISPTGTITRTLYDALGRVVSTWVGTNDSPASGYWSPDNNTAPANMIEVSAEVYDQGGVGDGNVTEAITFPGGGAAPRVTQNFYDWRDRLLASKQGVEDNEDDKTNRAIRYTTYDNLGEAVLVQQYEGDGVNLRMVDGVPQPPDAALLRGQTAVAYDDQGRVYQKMVFAVDPATGAVSSTALTTNSYYDQRGNRLAESDPGGLWTKNQYDGAGRLTIESRSDGGSGTRWIDAASVAGDIVLEQTETVYDGNNNVVETISRQRFDQTTGLGELGDPQSTAAPRARVYSTGSYYDAADRLTATVNVGTNGGTAWVRPSSVPARSDTVLVTSYTYTAAGWAQDAIDPRGLDTHTDYDTLGRPMEVIADYTGNAEAASSDVATLYSYDGDNHVLTMTAMQPAGTPSQTTAYVYGVTPADGSAIASNDLLARALYPDPSTGQPSSNQATIYTYNALGQIRTMTDRNTTRHEYGYDVLGRQISDTVRTLGPGVDDSVLRLDTAYDPQGNAYLFTSYADTAGTVIVNQVEDVYNGLGQLTGQYQAHTGAVVFGTTPEVQYTYEEMANGADNSRLTSMIYPDGRVVGTHYEAGVDDRISRPSSIFDTTGILETYTYLGLNTVVERAHPQSSVELTYVNPSPSLGDAGDPYTGLDRFGRVVDQLWLNTDTGAATDEFQYRYDADSNILARNNLVNSALDEQYGYNRLNQLASFGRGSQTETWSLDALGNWTSVTTNGTSVTAAANAQNQTVSLSEGTMASYDNSGDLTADPTNGNTYEYDAWGRLVAVGNSGTMLASYSYDGLGRRITETHTATLDLYFSKDWQVVEEQAGGVRQSQYVWSPVYVDALVERDSSDGTRLSVQQDAHWNVTAVVDGIGAVQERYLYDPYGTVSVLAPDWSSRSGSMLNWVYLHQGGRQDPVTGLYNFRNRDYSPVLGRWMEEDPSGLAAGDPNLYRYEANDPTSRLDPLGLYSYYWYIGPASKCYTPQTIADAFKANPNQFFPFIVQGDPGPDQIVQGEHYHLTGTLLAPFGLGKTGIFGWGVTVTQVTPNGFTFVTDPNTQGAPFGPGPGATIQFRIVNLDGALYLTQTGLTANGQDPFIIEELGGAISWYWQSQNFKRYLQQLRDSPCPCK